MKVIQPAEPRLNVAFRFELFKIFLFLSCRARDTQIAAAKSV